MRALFVITLLLAATTAITAEEAVPLLTLDAFNDPEVLQALVEASGPTFTTCDSSNGYPFEVSNLLIQPWPLVKGKTATMVMVGKADSEIALSQLKISTKVKTVTINTQTVDESGKSIAAGTSRFNVAVTIPSYTPSGSYIIELELLNTANGDAACINVPVTI